MNNISERDYELLSAYIDSMLTEDEQHILEARLAQEPELRQELNALRQTLLLVKGLPGLKAPRDFTLTREMVGAIPTAKVQRVPKTSQKRVIRFPVVSLVSAAASLIITLAGLGLLLTANQQDLGITTSEDRAGLTSNTMPNGVATRESQIAAAPTEQVNVQQAGDEDTTQESQRGFDTFEASETANMEQPESEDDGVFRQTTTASGRGRAELDGTSTAIARMMLPSPTGEIAEISAVVGDDADETATNGEALNDTDSTADSLDEEVADADDGAAALDFSMGSVTATLPPGCEPGICLTIPEKACQCELCGVVCPPPPTSNMSEVQAPNVMMPSDAQMPPSVVPGQGFGGGSGGAGAQPPPMMPTQINGYDAEGQELAESDAAEPPAMNMPAPTVTTLALPTLKPTLTLTPLPTIARTSPSTQVAAASENEVEDVPAPAEESSATELLDVAPSDEGQPSNELGQDDFGVILLVIGGVLMLVAAGSFAIYRRRTA